MAWTETVSGLMHLYRGDEGIIRLRLAGEPRFPLDVPPVEGEEAWVVDALTSPDPLLMLDLALEHVRSIIVDVAWLCPPSEASSFPFDPRIGRAWAEWREAHPELTWVGDRVQLP